MTKTLYSFDAATQEWVFPDGKRLPLVAGGSDAGDVIVVGDAIPTAPVQQTQVAPEHRFSADDIEKARREEKEKLYPRIEKMSEQLELFTKERDEALRLRAEEQQKQDEARKQAEESEMSFKDLLKAKEDEWVSKFEATQTEWAERFGALEAERDAHAALLEKERRFQELTSYKSRRIQEEGDNLMPELLDFIQGDSEEAIESAISAVAARTSAIVENIQQATAGRPVLRPVPATGQAPSGPAENLTEQRTITMSDLQNMDMSTYAANREALLAAVSKR